MLLDDIFEIKINSTNIDYFNSVGYKCSLKDTIQVHSKDLQEKSNRKIRYKCDKCGTIHEISYCDYTKRHKEKNDYCEKCKYEKAKITNLRKYGSENPMQSDRVKEKFIRTSMDKYGTPHPNQNEAIKAKRTNTFIKRYGVDNPAKLDFVKEKIRETDLKKYGVPHHLSSKRVIEKRIDTNLKKYGVRHGLESPEIIAKGRKTLYKHNNCPTSKQQLYVNSVYQGILNYPVGNTNLDIYFEKEKVYCEWDGGGHRYMVYCGAMTDKEFDRRETSRYFYLKELGLKEFRIVSLKDYVPSDEILLGMKDFAFNKLLKEGYNWIKFDIENEIVVYKDSQEPYKYK